MLEKIKKMFTHCKSQEKTRHEESVSVKQPYNSYDYQSFSRPKRLQAIFFSPFENRQTDVKVNDKITHAQSKCMLINTSVMAFFSGITLNVNGIKLWSKCKNVRIYVGTLCAFEFKFLC